RSPLTQGRGSKPLLDMNELRTLKSPLTQGRRSKPPSADTTNIVRHVAPHAGARIETSQGRSSTGRPPVAPHAGAGIETSARSPRARGRRGRPSRRGAIETLIPKRQR